AAAVEEDAALVAADNVLLKRCGAADGGVLGLVRDVDARAFIVIGSRSGTVQTDKAVEDLVVVGVALDGDAVAVVGGDRVLRDDGYLFAANQVVVGGAVDQHPIGPVGQRRRSRRI